MSKVALSAYAAVFITGKSVKKASSVKICRPIRLVSSVWTVKVLVTVLYCIMADVKSIGELIKVASYVRSPQRV